MPPHRPQLRLAPGVRVVRRGRDLLQVGLYADRRVVLPDTPMVVDLLDRLASGAPLRNAREPHVQTAVQRLVGRGLALPPDSEGTTARRLAVLGGVPGLDLPPVLESAGLTRSRIQRADAALVLACGEPAREVVDPLLRSGTTHVVVRLVDGGAVVGPFTVPGTTACLRCIDAHHTVIDPDHVAVTTRYVEATRRLAAGGRPDGLDPTLALLAVVWAVRDVAGHLAGRTPATWSRTLHLGPEPADRREETWSRHPSCGCCWSLGDLVWGTMEA